MTSHSIIRDLNDILKKQLTAINQFFVHSKIQKKNGFASLAFQYAKFGLTGGKISEKLIELLVEQDELPQIKDYDLLKSHREIQKQFLIDLSLLLSITEALHKSIKKCKEQNENEILSLLQEILSEQEKQIDFLESQLSVIETVGLDTYIYGLRKSQQHALR